MKTICSNKKKLLFVVLIVLICVCVDQLIKISIHSITPNGSRVIINGVLNFTYVENTGGAFGIGSNSIIWFIITNILIILAALVFLVIKRTSLSTKAVIGISLIVSGGFGNLIDRIFRGYVVDYIDINPLFNYPVFNFADICIVLGVILIIILIMADLLLN